MPQPILRDTTGRVVGNLPSQFPIDLPSKLKTRFARWHGGLPQIILIYDAGWSALAPHWGEPIHLDACTGTYR